LSKLGVIHIGPFQQMVKQPQAMDRVWIAGRAFTLIAFTLSAFLLFLTLRNITPPTVVLAVLAIYLFCPATIMFSQVVKPHWYALLWANGAILILVRAFLRHRMSMSAELLLAAFLGLAVGTVTTFALFAVLVWGAMMWLAARKAIARAALVRVPILAIVAFIASNPYYILNWHAAQVERVRTENWLQPAFNLHELTTFIHTSLFSGFGIAFTIMAGAIAVWRLLVGPLPARLFAIALLVPVGIMAGLTASMDTWIVNFRYVSYLLPVALLFLAIWRWPFRTPVLILCAAATATQAIPLKLAYFDENSATHSTRLLTAAWIDANIPTTDPICLVTKGLVPYEVPPFRFDQYKLVVPDSPDCRWLVQVERYPATTKVDQRLSIVKRFTPRLSPQAFPLVWGHINPQITIYRKRG
jgi:hypothetical protein